MTPDFLAGMVAGAFGVLAMSCVVAWALVRGKNREDPF
jgi:hypothetical protein